MTPLSVCSWKTRCCSAAASFCPLNWVKATPAKYVVEDGKVRLPFTAIRGLGDAAAVALEQATMHGQEYISVEELQQASGVAQSVFDKLRAVGALGNLPGDQPGGFVQYDIKGLPIREASGTPPLQNPPQGGIYAAPRY